MLVCYSLQSDKTKELNGFKVNSTNQELTVGDIKKQLPLKGNFYLRFKTILQDENPPIAVWLDGLDDFAPVPTFKDQILVKILPIPPFTLPVPTKKLYKHTSPQSEHPSQSSPHKPNDLLPEFSIHSKHPERSHSAQPNFADFSKHAPVNKPFDPMAEFLSAQSKPTQNVKPKPVSDPTNGLSTEQLKKRAEDKINVQVNKKTEDVKKMWESEASLRNEKMDAEKEFSEKLNNWESRNHQKNNIRALLATMHNVLWRDSGWEAIGPGDLISNAQVKAAYFKSLNIIHPDKHQNDPPGVQYVAERIFAAVNEAFRKFRTNS